MPDTFTIDPQARLDYSIDWSQWLAAGDSVATATWTVSAGVTVDSSSLSANVATIWLKSATGSSFTASCHITTTQGRQDDRTLSFVVNDR